MFLQSFYNNQSSEHNTYCHVTMDVLISVSLIYREHDHLT